MVFLWENEKNMPHQTVLIIEGVSENSERRKSDPHERVYGLSLADAVFDITSRDEGFTRHCAINEKMFSTKNSDKSFDSSLFLAF